MSSMRMNNIPISPIVKHQKLINEISKTGVKFIKANIGQPTNELNNHYYNKINDEKLSINLYSSPLGLPDLRKKVADLYNIRVGKEKYSMKDIAITQGASDGIIKVLYSICDEEDEIIILEPFFSDYKVYCSLLGIRIKAISSKDLTLEKLNNIYSSKVKAVLFAHPNNPDGRILTKKDMSVLKKFSKEKGVYIISDEVYSDIVFEQEYVSFSTVESDRVVVIDSASKKINCCGSRIGFVITKNAKLIDNIADLNDITISISNTEQIGVRGLLENYDEIVKNNKEYYREQRDIVINRLKNAGGIDFTVPDGGISLLISLPVNDCDDYIEWLIRDYRTPENRTLLLTSAEGFYVNPVQNSIVRFCYTMKREDLIEALNILLDSIEVYNKK